MHNPYADHGTIIVGDRFVGRKNDIQAIANRLLGLNAFGSLGLVGLSRVGKSSLAYNSIFLNKEELNANKIFPVYLSLGEYLSPRQLFNELVGKSYQALAEVNSLPIRFTETIQNLSVADDTSYFGNVKRFFELCRRDNYRIVCVMDEFDSARWLFEGRRQYLHWLRELASNPTYKIGLLLISKRSLSHIATQITGSDSKYWYNVLAEHFLSVFTEDDFKLFIEQFTKNLSSARIDLVEDILYYCGRHPFYLDIFAYHVIESSTNDHQIDLNQVKLSIRVPFQEEFQSLVEMLSEDDRLGKLVQVLFGPVLDVTQFDIERLMRYGVLFNATSSGYETFSPYFHDYLRLTSRSIDLWPLWKETEQSTRRIINSTLTGKYSANWPNSLEAARPKLKPILESLQKQQTREQQRFQDRASTNLLDYAYPSELFSIISAEWSLFEPVFGRDRNYWSMRFDLLSKIRTPLAHNRDLSLLEFERITGEGYCKEILHLIGLDESRTIT